MFTHQVCFCIFLSALSLVYSSCVLFIFSLSCVGGSYQAPQRVEGMDDIFPALVFCGSEHSIVLEDFKRRPFQAPWYACLIFPSFIGCLIFWSCCLTCHNAQTLVAVNEYCLLLFFRPIDNPVVVRTPKRSLQTPLLTKPTRHRNTDNKENSGKNSISNSYSQPSLFEEHPHSLKMTPITNIDEFLNTLGSDKQNDKKKDGSKNSTEKEKTTEQPNRNAASSTAPAVTSSTLQHDKGVTLDCNDCLWLCYLSL